MAAPPITAPPLPELDYYVFQADRYNRDRLPRRLAPTDVARFLIARLNKGSRVVSFERAEKAADFYDVYEVSSHFVSMMDGKEASPADFHRSVICGRIVARLGDPMQREFAGKYYRYLIGRASTTEQFEWLGSLAAQLERLGPVEPLRAAVAAHAERLRARLAREPEVEQELQRIKTLVEEYLVMVDSSTALKVRILEIGARRTRIDREIDHYLGLRPEFGQLMKDWAAARLRRESWAPDPPQQIMRADVPALKAELVAAFRDAKARVQAHPGLAEESKEFMNLACLRAIDYFGGRLEPTEQEEFNKNLVSPRYYILSWIEAKPSPDRR